MSVRCRALSASPDICSELTAPPHGMGLHSVTHATHAAITAGTTRWYTCKSEKNKRKVGVAIHSCRASLIFTPNFKTIHAFTDVKQTEAYI